MQRPETTHESLEALLLALSAGIEISSRKIKMPVLPVTSPLCDKLFQTQVHTREFFYLLSRFLPQGNLISYALIEFQWKKFTVLLHLYSIIQMVRQQGRYPENLFLLVYILFAEKKPTPNIHIVETKEALPTLNV